MDREISKRIWVTRYFMVIGIVILHLPQFQPLNDITTPFEYIKAFFAHGVFRATVPLLTVISGFLVISSRLDASPFRLLSKKITSVLIPLVIWNIPVAAAIYLSQRYNLLAHSFSSVLYPAEITNWANALVGLFETPANYPLNFLRDLFAISLLAPAYGLFVRRAPIIGLAVVLVVYFYNLDGSYVLRNSMLVSFYLGGLAAAQQWDLTRLDRFAPALFGIFIALCAGIVWFKIENRELFRMLSPLMVWPALSLLSGTRYYELLYRHSRSSFFTFLAHGPLLMVFWILYSRISNVVPYFVFWLVTPFLTVVLCIYAARLFRHVLPKIASIALGGR